MRLLAKHTEVKPEMYDSLCWTTAFHHVGI